MYDESFNNSLAVHISSEHEARKKKRRTIWPSDELEDVQKERHCDMIQPQETMHLNNTQHEAQLPMDSKAEQRSGCTHTHKQKQCHPLAADEIENNHFGASKQPYSTRRLCDCKSCMCMPNPLNNLEPVTSHQEIEGAAQSEYSQFHLPQL